MSNAKLRLLWAASRLGLKDVWNQWCGRRELNPQDAEVKSTSDGKRVANFSLAINSFHNGKGEKVQRVEWVRCVAWNKQAEIAGKFVTKGKQLFIEGRLQTRRYEDDEGVLRTVSEVVVTTLRALGGAARDTEGGTSSNSAADSAVDSDRDEIPF